MNKTVKIELTMDDFIKLLKQEREKIQLNNKLYSIGLFHFLDSINEELCSPSAIDFLMEKNEALSENDLYYELESSKPIEVIACEYWAGFNKKPV